MFLFIKTPRCSPHTRALQKRLAEEVITKHNRSAAGDRSGSEARNVQYYGVYWSATENYSDYAYGLSFSSVEEGMGDYVRYDGQSVRLVKDL